MPPPPQSDDALSDEFAKQLAAEMETMMRALSGEDPSCSSKDTDASGSDTRARDVAFREAWDKMLIEDLEGGGKGNGLDTFLGRGDDPEKEAVENTESAGGGAEQAEVEEDPFQKAIRQAMEKLQDSDDSLKVRHLLASKAVLLCRCCA